MQERDGLASDDPRAALRRHLVEETIRDVEGDVARFESLRKLEEAFAAPGAEHKAQGSGPPLTGRGRDYPIAALIRAWPGSATSRPAATYSLSLLRRVRIEMPRILAAWVRLPRQ